MLIFFRPSVLQDDDLGGLYNLGMMNLLGTVTTGQGGSHGGLHGRQGEEIMGEVAGMD